MFKRIVFLFLLPLLLLPTISFSNLIITVEDDARWGNARVSNIKRLCENVALHFQEHLDNDLKIKGKLTIVWNNNPKAFYRDSFGGEEDEYKIGLHITYRDWANLSYQFGHEFCHLMHNFEDFKGNPNGWFLEGICELANLWVLRRMSETWETHPPYDNWRDYRHTLADHHRWQTSRPEIQYDGSGADWLEEWEDELRDHDSGAFSYTRVSQLTYKFLDIFEDNPKAWNAIRQMPNSTQKMSGYMQDWYDAVNVKYKEYVSLIAKVMGVSISSDEYDIDDSITEDYIYLTFTHEDHNSLVPINDSQEWDGWEGGIWEKTPDGDISNKPHGDYRISRYMSSWDHWMYSHAPSRIVYDISGGFYTRFSANIDMTSCGGLLSVEVIVYADGVEIYKSGELRHGDRNTSIEFDIPENTEILTIEVSDVEDGRCDHFVLGNPRLFYNMNTDVNTDNDTGNRSDTVSLLPISVPSPNIGQQLELSLKITNGETVAGYQATVQFDDTALRYVESGISDYLPDGAFFVPPILEGNLVKLNAASLAGESNGNGTLATLTFEVISVKASTLTLSDVLLSNSGGETFAPQVENAQITEPTKLTGDVNGDGTVNIADLVLVASNLGQTGQNAADVNSDGVVNIADLVLVAGALGTSAAPSIHPQALEMFTATDVKKWVSAAQQLNPTDMNSQRGILFLQQLLVALTPKETALLPNFPNPFNPETWIPYHLAKGADVTLRIYAMNGALVRSLTLGHQAAGKYQNRSRAAYWNGKNAFGEPLASGLYFYTLTAGDFTATRKMIIQK